MNTKKILVCLSLLGMALLNSQVLRADKDHGAHAKNVGGPNGGRIISNVDPHCEFLLRDDNKIEIRFLDENNAVVKPGIQVVTLIGGDRSAPTQLTFAEESGVLVSNEAFPKGNSLPVILEIKESPDSPIKRNRFLLNLVNCGSCDYQEYACVCGH